MKFGRPLLRFAAAAGLALWLVVGSSVVSGSPDAQATSTAAAEASDLPPGFVPIKGKDPSEQVNPVPLVVLAYASVLAGLLLYVILLARRQGEISRQIADLADELRRRNDPR